MSINTNPINQTNYQNLTRYSNLKKLPKIGSPSSLDLKQTGLYDTTSSFFNMAKKQGAETCNSSIDFFTRNYDFYLDKINQKNKIYNSKLKTESELNSLLFKLKKYYSEVIAINKKKAEELIFLKNVHNFEEFKLNQVIELQDIELPDEKISVRNYKELRLTKDEVEIQLRNLLKEKQRLDELIKNASEYFKTIEYMCEEEKNRFKEIKSEINIIQERIHSIKHYQRIIDYNIAKEKIKIKEEKKLDDKLGKGLELVNEVNLEEKIKNEKLNIVIFEKEKIVEELKNKLLEIKRLIKLENIEYQNEIKSKIEKGKEFSENQRIKEKKIAEIIYCLYLIQSYFINEEYFNKEKMMNSQEYKIIESQDFDIFFKKKKNIIKGRNNDASNNIIISAFSENIQENNKYKLDDNDDDNKEEIKKEEEKSKNSQISESEKSNENESDEEEENIEKEEEKKEKNIPKPSIFLTNLQKKLSLKNIPLQLLDFIKENENKEKNPKRKRPNSLTNKKSDIFIYTNEIETKNKEKEKEDSINSYKCKSEKNNPINNDINYDNNTSKKINDIDYPSVEELKEKFSLIKMNRKILFDYNSKLTSRLNFYKLQINQFHKKELELEEQKSLYLQKASKVIQQNFYGFKHLVKLNPEIKKFIRKNRQFIEEVKIQYKKNKLKEMNKTLLKTNPINNLEIAQLCNTETDNDNNCNNNKYEIDIQFRENFDKLISSLNNMIMRNKDFLMKCEDYLNQIKIFMESIINYEKKENINENTNLMKDYIKIISEEQNELNEIVQKINEKKNNDKYNLINYIKELINYSQKEEELKKIFDINELNTDLLYNFYKDIETKRVKNLFYNQFKLKNFPQLDIEFNYFISISEDSIKHLEKIKDIINNIEKNEKLNMIISQRGIKTKKRTREMTKLIAINTINKNQNIKELGKINNLRYTRKSRIFNGFKTISLSTQKDTSYSELEFMTGGKIDEDDIPDNYAKKRKKKIKIKKASSIEEKIVNKLYSPFLKQTSYLRKLNKNMKGIKSMTTLNCQTNHTLKKRKSEVDILTHQMYIYNNPLINPDKLANQTYNSLVGLAVKKYHKYKYDKNFLNPNLIY